MQNGNARYDIGPGEEIQTPNANGEIMQPDVPPGMMPIQVISGFREDENGEMELEYERLFVQKPPEGLFHEPLDYGPEPAAEAKNERKPTARQLYMEKERLATFEGRWSADYPVQPRDLARDGLYYVGPGDKVKCVFCQKTIRGWEPGDVVDKEHKRIYPNCPFVLGRCNQMNVPLNSPDTMHHSYGVTVKQEEGQAADAMKDMARRLMTFENRWPTTVPVEPKHIAEAGLYCIGVKDKTKCFRCNKILERWEKGDDPWTEHARISPSCPYVLEIKGREFVDAVLRQVYPGNHAGGASFQGNAEAVAMEQGEEVESSDITAQMAKLKIDEDMNSLAVKAFRECFEEVPEVRIRQLLERLRLEKGPTHSLTTADLLPLTDN